MRRPAKYRSLSTGSRLVTAIALVLGAGTFLTDFTVPTPTVPSRASAAVWHGQAAYYGTSRRVARRTSRRTASRYSGGYGYGGGVYGAAAPVATLPPNCTTVVSGGAAAQQCGGSTYTPYMQGSTVVYAQ